MKLVKVAAAAAILAASTSANAWWGDDNDSRWNNDWNNNMYNDGYGSGYGDGYGAGDGEIGVIADFHAHRVALDLCDRSGGDRYDAPAKTHPKLALLLGVDDLGFHRGARHVGLTDVDVALAAKGEHAVEGDGRGVVGEFAQIDGDNVAGLHLDLRPAVFDDGVHRSWLQNRPHWGEPITLPVRARGANPARGVQGRLPPPARAATPARGRPGLQTPPRRVQRGVQIPRQRGDLLVREIQQRGLDPQPRRRDAPGGVQAHEPLDEPRPGQLTLHRVEVDPQVHRPDNRREPQPTRQTPRVEQDRGRLGERIVARFIARSSPGPAHLNPVAGGLYLVNGRVADTCCMLALPSHRRSRSNGP